MTNIKIRPVTTEDRDSLELLTRLQVSDRNEQFDEKRFEWGLLRRLYDPLQRHGLFIAEHIEEEDTQNKKVVGMIFSELRVDPFGHSEGYIKQFYVRPKYRNKSIGKRLLNAVVSHLKKMNVQIIKVNIKPGAEDTFRMYSEMNFQTKFSVLELKVKEEGYPQEFNEEFNFEIDLD